MSHRSSVSVVIPAYNHSAYILETIASVQQQTHPALEIIVVNDDSPDDTEFLLSPLVRSGAIRYFRKANGGAATARNCGSAVAVGTYLLFLDDDDVLEPGALHLLVGQLDGAPTAAVAFGANRRFGNGLALPQTRSTTDTTVREELDLPRLFLVNPITTPGQALIRRSAFEAVGGFAEDVWGADDWDLWFRIIHQGEIVRIGDHVLRYRLHDSNASKNAPRLYAECVRVIDRQLMNLPAKDRVRMRARSYAGNLPWWRVTLEQFIRDSVRHLFLRAAAVGTWAVIDAIMRTMLAGARTRFSRSPDAVHLGPEKA